MKASVTTRGNVGRDPGADLDESASLEQVSRISNDGGNAEAAERDIDEGHGGINDIVRIEDGAASSTERSVHASSAPTPEEMGIN